MLVDREGSGRRLALHTLLLFLFKRDQTRMQIIYPCLRKFLKNKKEFSYKRIDKLQYNWQGIRPFQSRQANIKFQFTNDLYIWNDS